jgi:integrase
VLRFLWEYHGTPKLDHQVSTYPGLRPRNVTASYDEINAVLAAAPAHLLLMIYLCCDLAIRSGTAATLGAEHYDQRRGELRFQTKMGARLCLPITEEIEALIAQCNLHDRTPFVRQLWIQHRKRVGGQGRVPALKARNAESLRHAFAELRQLVGIERRFTFHDLRRTTAVGMLRVTHDVRDVQALLGHKSLQATIWYLDHDLRPVSRNTLELIKGNRNHTTDERKGPKTA